VSTSEKEAILDRLDAVVERLDTVSAVLQLAHHDRIEQARRQLRSDPINSVILDACEDWTSAGVIQKAAREAGGAERTVRSRLRELVARRALAERGAGPSRQYRATGLVL
jgi:hypothetical protein